MNMNYWNGSLGYEDEVVNEDFEEEDYTED